MQPILKDSPVPIYRQLVDHFQGRILDGSLGTGERLPSIRAIQKETGVAAESVKRALRDLTAGGFIVKIQGKGTFVAPRTTQGVFWGLVLPFYTEFYNQAAAELSRVARDHHARLEHACDYDHWERQIEIVRDYEWRGAEAIIVVPSRDERKTLEAYQKLARNRLVMLFDRSSIASQLPYVIQDHVLAVQAALEHLVRTGSRRIGYVRDPLWPAGNPVYETMEAAYSQFCSDLPGQYIRIFGSPYDLGAADLRHGEFDGLLCANDLIACLVTGRLRENGVEVPGRVQVVGNHDAEVGRFFTPQITTTSPNLSRMCELVGRIVENARTGARVDWMQHVMLPTVIARGTTRPLPPDAGKTIGAAEDTIRRKEA